ncbi:MAG TPA: hypothetical protein VHK69_10285, partial [Chitinophagaceae bacterium]|nr:hypothetical protein [Chitinophagaceae bacterium]
MSWNTLLGIASTCAFLLPMTLIMAGRLYQNRSLLALFLYFLLVFVYNLMTEGFLPVSIGWRRGFGTLVNYLDAPLMLIFLLFFCVQQRKRNAILITLVALIVFELAVGIVYRFSARSVHFVLGPGILSILVFSFMAFLQQLKQTILRNRRYGNTVMSASVLFTYACYALIYVFYYLLRTPSVSDV